MKSCTKKAFECKRYSKVKNNLIPFRIVKSDLFFSVK